MPASAQRACYSSNWHDSQRDPPPQIQLADISSTASQTALTPQTSASCQPLPIGSDTLGPPASTSLLRKLPHNISRQGIAAGYIQATIRRNNKITGPLGPYPLKTLAEKHQYRDGTSLVSQIFEDKVNGEKNDNKEIGKG